MRKFWVVLLIASLLAPLSSHAQGKSKSYKYGYNWIFESNRDSLSEFGIKQVFGVTGQPVYRKVKIWCERMPLYMLRYPPKVNDWVKGCIDATMSLNERQFGW
jgi:hypothetical protein